MELGGRLLEAGVPTRSSPAGCSAPDRRRADAARPRARPADVRARGRLVHTHVTAEELAEAGAGSRRPRRSSTSSAPRTSPRSRWSRKPEADGDWRVSPALARRRRRRRVAERLGGGGHAGRRASPPARHVRRRSSPTSSTALGRAEWDADVAASRGSRPRRGPAGRQAAGPTSHDVVQAVRRASGQSRVGHTGTLDPPRPACWSSASARDQARALPAGRGPRPTPPAWCSASRPTRRTPRARSSRGPRGHVDERALLRGADPLPGRHRAGPADGLGAEGRRRAAARARPPRRGPVERDARPVTVHDLVLDAFDAGRPDHPEASSSSPARPAPTCARSRTTSGRARRRWQPRRAAPRRQRTVHGRRVPRPRRHRGRGRGRDASTSCCSTRWRRSPGAADRRGGRRRPGPAADPRGQAPRDLARRPARPARTGPSRCGRVATWSASTLGRVPRPARSWSGCGRRSWTRGLLTDPREPERGPARARSTARRPRPRRGGARPVGGHHRQLRRRPPRSPRPAAPGRRRRSRGGVRSVAVTFDPHPAAVLRPGTSRRPSARSRTARLPCSSSGSTSSSCCRSPTSCPARPEDFLERVLVERLEATKVIVGTNFRFGHRAAGDVVTLADAGDTHGFAVEAVTLLDLDGAPISSSELRRRIGEEGDLAWANAALGRPFSLAGEVVRGDQRGRTIGFPTANIEVPRTGCCRRRRLRGHRHGRGRPALRGGHQRGDPAHLRRLAYLDTATMGLPPRRTVRAVQDALARWQHGTDDARAYDDEVEQSRRAYARLVGVEPSWVATGAQVSAFVGLVAASLPPGSEVLTVEGDFTSVLFPFHAQAARQVRVREVPLDHLIDAVTSSTSLVAVSAVQSADGRCVDLAGLAATCEGDRDTHPGRHHPGGRVAPGRRRSLQLHDRCRVQVAAGAAGHRLPDRPTRAPRCASARGRRVVRGGGPLDVDLRLAAPARDRRPPFRPVTPPGTPGRDNGPRSTCCSRWVSRRCTPTRSVSPTSCEGRSGWRPRGRRSCRCRPPRTPRRCSHRRVSRPLAVRGGSASAATSPPRWTTSIAPWTCCATACCRADRRFRRAQAARRDGRYRWVPCRRAPRRQVPTGSHGRPAGGRR
jgi:hypothetical protein